MTPRHTFVMLLVSVVLAVPAIATANALDDAKAAGYLGERWDGYLGLVNENAPASVRALMDRINAQRREQYQRIAARNGVDLADVEKLAGAKAIEHAAPGTMVDTGNGWRRR